MRYSKGICWVDDTRIPYKDENISFNTIQRGKLYGRNSYNKSITEGNTPHYKTEGRFTPNLLVCDYIVNKDNSRYYDLDLWFNHLIQKL